MRRGRWRRCRSPTSPNTGLDPEQLKEFERDRADLVEGEKLRLRRTLEEFGVLFVPEDAEGGYGVRRKFTRTKVKRLENWENEGGTAYEETSKPRGLRQTRR